MCLAQHLAHSECPVTAIMSVKVKTEGIIVSLNYGRRKWMEHERLVKTWSSQNSLIFIVAGSVKWYNYFGRKSGSFS